MISSLYIVFLQLTLVTSQISWENCDSNSNSIKLLNVTINPYPIKIPGSISIEVSFHTNQDLTNPIKAEVALHRKILFSYISLPCISGIGSCTYDDLCTLCPQCGCPLRAGDHALTIPITIYIDSWALAGNYQGQIVVQTNSGEKGCVKISNVHIKSSK
ncbi:unnamed protein product [Rotaria sp. Silwood1]|nr:unnamed protein product [Rotaria sp. Silwood1]CAF3432751.1 unnamed protein product [Rotaria sp. Silwood1]CAF3823917.1 unnamed protein product [Rotaria sp. Silwood1]CAF4611028.1 unnamed protein product [Rotaria sp. Silwood1]CAF4938827.1 unnamed protein product [Rotaria sp. Silwood1]